MKKIITLLAVVGVVALLNACYYDKFNEIYPTSAYKDPCDVKLDTVYSQSIQLIMATNCVSCHSGSNASGNIILDNYESVRSQADKVYKTVTKASGVQPMPPNGTIQDCEIQRLQAWIKKGTPQ